MALPGLVIFESADSTIADVDGSTGVVTLSGNSATQLALTASAGAAEATVRLPCNLMPAIGDIDLGAAQGAPLGTWRQCGRKATFPQPTHPSAGLGRLVGDEWMVPCTTNTGAALLGAFALTMAWDPAALEVVAVESRFDGIFDANVDDAAGTLRLSGVPTPPLSGGAVELFRLSIRALAPGDHGLSGAVVTMAQPDVDGTPVGPPPGPFVAGNVSVVVSGDDGRRLSRRAIPNTGINPRCAPVDANRDCEASVVDVKFILLYIVNAAEGFALPEGQAIEALLAGPSPCGCNGTVTPLNVLDVDHSGVVAERDAVLLNKILVGRLAYVGLPAVLPVQSSPSCLFEARAMVLDEKQATLSADMAHGIYFELFALGSAEATVPFTNATLGGEQLFRELGPVEGVWGGYAAVEAVQDPMDPAYFVARLPLAAAPVGLGLSVLQLSPTGERRRLGLPDATPPAAAQPAVVGAMLQAPDAGGAVEPAALPDFGPLVTVESTEGTLMCMEAGDPAPCATALSEPCVRGNCLSLRCDAAGAVVLPPVDAAPSGQWIQGACSLEPANCTACTTTCGAGEEVAVRCTGIADVVCAPESSSSTVVIAAAVAAGICLLFLLLLLVLLRRRRRRKGAGDETKVGIVVSNATDLQNEWRAAIDPLGGTDYDEPASMGTFGQGSEYLEPPSGPSRAVSVYSSRGGRVMALPQQAVVEEARVAEASRGFNTFSIGGADALHVAAEDGNVQQIRRLVQSGVSPNLAAADGSTPLHYAAAGGSLEATRALLQAGARPNLATRQGQTALHLAAHAGHTEVLVALLWAGADPHVATDGSGYTPLHLAVDGGHPDAVPPLVASSATVLDLEDAETWQTPLHWAAAKGSTQVVLALLECGADRELRDPEGRTPRDLALAAGHEELLELLDGPLPAEPEGYRDLAPGPAPLVLGDARRASFNARVRGSSVDGVMLEGSHRASFSARMHGSPVDASLQLAGAAGGASQVDGLMLAGGHTESSSTRVLGLKRSEETAAMRSREAERMAAAKREAAERENANLREQLAAAQASADAAAAERARSTAERAAEEAARETARLRDQLAVVQARARAARG